MTTQRMTGAWLSFFTSCVVVNHFLQSQVSWFDIVYAGFLAPLVASAFIESKALKIFQVAVIFIAGAVIVSMDQPSQPAGFVIMAFAPMYSYTYGLLSKHIWIKSAAFLLAYAILFLFSLKNPLTAAMWLMMCFTIHAGIWVNVRHLVDKARRADEIVKRNLEQDLVTSEALLEETVKAGMVLVNELKSKDAENGCKE